MIFIQCINGLYIIKAVCFLVITVEHFLRIVYHTDKLLRKNPIKVTIYKMAYNFY